MQVYDTMDAYARAGGECVAALGMFDGVHIGHAALISEAVRQAHERGVSAVVVTFKQNPVSVLCPERAPGDIQSLAEKLDAIAALGADAVVAESFTREYAHQSGMDFARALKDKLHVRAVVAGFNYTFGDKGACGVSELEIFGRDMGFDVSIMPPVEVMGGAVSSTRIRKCLEEGDVAQAGALMGRPYEMCGKIAQGKHLGHTLGFATANINIAPGRALPRAGVYVCAVRLDGGRWLPGVLNIGSQPTAPSGHKTCEVHILDDVGDVYGHDMRVRYIAFRRPERKFAGLDELRAQVEHDKADARAYFASGAVLARLNAPA